MASGWKTALGGFLKSVGGTALGAVATQLPDLVHGVVSPASKWGSVFGLIGWAVGGALQQYGLGHKQERVIEAVQENTQAVLEGSGVVPVAPKAAPARKPGASAPEGY